MGECLYCGEVAGFLKKTHKECKQRHEKGKAEIIDLVKIAASKSSDLSLLENKIEEIAETCRIGKNSLDSLLINGWEKAVDIAFEDNFLSLEEEEHLITLMEHFGLSQYTLDANGRFTKIVKGAVLRDILDGNVKERVQVNGQLPFNFQKSEKVVWVFKDVDYLEEKTRTRYVGGSQGASVRIAKGIYYRAGGFKGERVQTSETIHSDTGLLGVTNKHIYFAGKFKRFRIAYNKIVAFEPYSNGIGIQRDAQTAKPQSFITGDGWFTYNLITNLAQM